MFTFTSYKIKVTAELPFSYGIFRERINKRGEMLSYKKHVVLINLDSITFRKKNERIY